MLTIIAPLIRHTFIVWMGLLCVGHGALAGVSIVDDGSNGGPAKILIQSAIKKGDLIAFENALAKVERTATTRINDIPFVTVELNSPGGDVVEALGIGRAIYKNLAMTMVRPGKECVSACVFIFVAGAVRTPDEGASIGLHRPLLVSWTNISAAEAHARYNGLMNYLRDYFRELGISDRAFDIMMRTDSYAMRYFSPSELSDLSLRGESPRWKQYFSRKLTTEAAANLPFKSLMPLPKLPKPDESYRYLVFMPGAYHPGTDYQAGTDLPTPNFTWASLDGEKQTLDWRGPDIRDLENLVRRVADLLTPLWWLIALIAFEILRGVNLRDVNLRGVNKAYEP